MLNYIVKFRCNLVYNDSCESKRTIKEAIFNGAHTFPAVKEATRAGTGACGGKGCGPRIVKLLAELKEQGRI
ncbi:MAG: (2Fe-2S)-binding protein [Veillonella sp.]|nr:(2Fe-2S)-binding protein [Veillonella sp.]